MFGRNIVRKPGPIADSPTTRALNKEKRGGIGVEWDYRLIDFGRSELTSKTERWAKSGNAEKVKWYNDMLTRKVQEYHKLNHWVQGFTNTLD